METERLILRVPTYDDFGELYSVHANPEANIFNPGWKKPSIEEYRKTLDEIIEHHKKYGFGYYSMVDKTDNRVSNKSNNITNEKMGFDDEDSHSFHLDENDDHSFELR